MPVATAQRETSSRVESSFDFSGFYGVKGWLLLFCILVTIANPLSAAAEALRIRSVAVTILDAGFAALCICTGYRLWSIKPKSLRWVEIYFVVRLALAAVTLMGAIISKRPALGRDFSLNPSLESGITNVYGTIIWWAYFKKSKRVKATYGRNL